MQTFEDYMAFGDDDPWAFLLLEQDEEEPESYLKEYQHSVSERAKKLDKRVTPELYARFHREKPNSTYLKNQRLKKIRILHKKGGSSRSIALELGISQPTVSRGLQQIKGIEQRKKVCCGDRKYSCG